MDLFLLNEFPFKETIPEHIKECFWAPTNPIGSFDWSNHLLDTIRYSKNTRRVYIYFLHKIFMVKVIGVLYLFSVPIVIDNHG